MDVNIKQVLPEFKDECDLLLASIEESLIKLENDSDNVELVNTIFRSIHTIKGTSGIFGFDAIVEFAHVMENVLDSVRDGKLRVSSEFIQLLLECQDHVDTQIKYVVEHGTPQLSEDILERDAYLKDKLRAYLGRENEGRIGIDELEARANMRSHERSLDQHQDKGSAKVWHISIRYGKELLKSGMDPIAFLRYMGKHGELHTVTPIMESLPSLDEADVEACYLGFEIDYETALSRDDIEKIFEFVRDDCQLKILPTSASVEEYIALINELPEDKKLLIDIMAKSGAVSAKELTAGLTARKGGAKQEDATNLGVANSLLNNKTGGAARDAQENTKTKKGSEARSIRVDADRLDALINLVGELVIASAGSQLRAKINGDEDLIESISHTMRLVEEIRGTSLHLRMVHISDTFNKFHRVVRDISREMGKDISLEIKGGETELDRTVVEKLSDPLMHLVRNAIDHGIETSEKRLVSGKKPQGKLTLNAYHDSGSIIIEVSDDGCGMDPEKILAKALEIGLVKSTDNLQVSDIYRLIFEPGFTTAESVTNISGRGVGMDVVKKNIESLRGAIDVISEVGKGTTIRIRLPLTLSIIDGFLVNVGESFYVIPLDMVEECIEIDSHNNALASESAYVNLRGEVLPYLRLAATFGEKTNRDKRENIVVVRYGDKKAGLVVDSLLGEIQTVIKPLGKVFKRLRSLSGATILGTGEVAVILDVPALLNEIVTKEGTKSGVMAWGDGNRLH